jgi:hypothetical protein
MNQTEVTAFLMKILQANELNVTTHDEWVFPNGQLPAIKCTWSTAADSQSGKLDVEVLIEKGIIIEECFAGIGAGDVGFSDGFQSFALNSLPVLLAALWDKHDAEHVLCEEWDIGTDKYRLFLGNFGTRASNGVNPSVPNEINTAIEQALKNESLTKDCYWARMFFCNVDNSHKMYEALLNNKKWDRGEQALKALNWPSNEGYYSVRNFLVLKKE